MRTPIQFGAVLCLCLCAHAGCRLMNEQPDFDNHTLLKPAQSSPGSVRMEILWVRVPAGDPDLNGSAWQEIEEAQFDPAVQRELADNGFRAGVIKGNFPKAISQALHQHSASEDAPIQVTGETSELIADPIVRGRIKQMPRNKRHEITASDVYPSIPLLSRNQQELNGRTLEQVQAIYAMRVDPLADHGTIVELTPELHYGAARMRVTGGDEGVWHQTMQRDREVFDEMRIKARLTPGDTLVVMGRPDAGSRLGHYFHTVDSEEGPQQKLILIRLAEVPQGDTFAAMND
jgi:hypothetical protein